MAIENDKKFQPLPKIIWAINLFCWILFFFSIIGLMATINRRTKSFQVVPKKLGKPDLVIESW